MDKELKRQIKEDEIRSGLEHAVEWVVTNRETALKIAGGVLLVVALLGGYSYWRSTQEAQASAALVDALRAFEGVSKAEQPAGPAGSTAAWADERERYTKAAAGFDDVASRFSNSRSADWARYYAGVSRLRLGEIDRAREALKLTASHRDPMLKSLGGLALAEVERRAGQPAAAAEALGRLVADPAYALPKDHALLRQASCLEEAKRFGDARDLYQRVFQDFPGSVYAGEARNRFQQLETVAG
ncbi:MAG: tetratricopeptide repeat protein [Vicinamibacteria bacterium]|nr:tetratricopeptide repeat protein [Vicinamibacteria bacterium]